MYNLLTFVYCVNPCLTLCYIDTYIYTYRNYICIYIYLYITSHPYSICRVHLSLYIPSNYVGPLFLCLCLSPLPLSLSV